MTVQIEMRGRLDPVIIEGDMAETLNSFNLAAAKGAQFIILTQENGRGIAIYTPNILTFEELSDELLA